MKYTKNHPTCNGVCDISSLHEMSTSLPQVKLSKFIPHIIIAVVITGIIGTYLLTRRK